MPLPCNGVLLIQGNLPKVIQGFFQMHRNIMLVFLSPISIFIFVYGGWFKEPVDKVVPTGAPKSRFKKSLGSPNFLLPMMS